MNKDTIWLIGTGLMAIDYAKVLTALKKDFIVIGRGQTNAIKFKEATGITPILDSMEKIASAVELPNYAINAVGIDALAGVTMQLLQLGIKNILVEKPAVGYANEINELHKLCEEKNANICLAYNRRFYQSTIAAQKIIIEDGGVKSFNFEFTEWSHQIESIKHLKTQAELQNWFLGNSTHVIDLAFYLGGEPDKISSFVSGENEIEWHTKSSNFCGAGISKTGALFSYHANWKAPGRFSVEILTNKHRLIFRPLEKLQIQNIGSVAINMVEGIDYSLDENFKPGLYLQTQAFLENQLSNFCMLNEQHQKMDMYKTMSNYSE